MPDDDGLSQRSLLLEVRDDVRKIKDVLSAKADVADLRKLQDVVRQIDRDGSHGLRSIATAVTTNTVRLDVLENAAAAMGAVERYRRWLIGVAITVVALLCTLVGIVISNFLVVH